jgi:hypothetical protein
MMDKKSNGHQIGKGVRRRRQLKNLYMYVYIYKENANLCEE